LKIHNYKEALEYLYAQLPMFQRQGAAAYKKDLTNTLKICEAVGNPQNLTQTIHIAGTNGKGTTSHIIAGGLQAQGIKVGLYTSPHYKDFRERIKINGKYISQKYIIDFINNHREAIETIKPSFFEMTFVMALQYFVSQKVDIAVIETGLGGRLDSTNVITPLLSIITNISYDHQSMLGDTLSEIAGEKAGIIKPKIPVIIGETQDEVQQVFLKKAENTQSDIFFADQHTKINKNLQKDEASYDIFIDGVQWLSDLKIDIDGPFQDKNLITSLYSLKFLSQFLPISTEKIKEFFPQLAKNLGYMGRWQVLSHHPLVIADSAHNEGGLRYVMSRLEHVNQGHIHVVLGFVNDKNVADIIPFFPKNATYYFAKANIPRGLDAKTLQIQANEFGLNGKRYVSVKNAYKAAKRKAKPMDTIFIGGSIFVVAECL